MEKRNFVRVTVSIETRVAWRGRALEGSLLNLSVNGMFFSTLEKVPLHETVSVEIVLPPSIPEHSVKLSGRVVRVEATGIAIHFAMDLDAYRLLKAMLSQIIEEQIAEES